MFGAVHEEEEECFFGVVEGGSEEAFRSAGVASEAGDCRRLEFAKDVRGLFDLVCALLTTVCPVMALCC